MRGRIRGESLLPLRLQRGASIPARPPVGQRFLGHVERLGNRPIQILLGEGDLFFPQSSAMRG